MTVIFTFFAVTAVSIVLFGFWIVSVIVKSILGLARSWPRAGSPITAGRHCMNTGCRTINPMHASFCRRCGSSLAEVAARRPVMQPPRYDPRNGRGRQVASI